MSTKKNAADAPRLDPAALRPGLHVRRRPAGRSCTIDKVDVGGRKVLVNDAGKRFWVTMVGLVDHWY